jgi:hypothetical protein
MICWMQSVYRGRRFARIAGTAKNKHFCMCVKMPCGVVVQGIAILKVITITFPVAIPCTPSHRAFCQFGVGWHTEKNDSGCWVRDGRFAYTGLRRRPSIIKIQKTLANQGKTIVFLMIG